MRPERSIRPPIVAFRLANRLSVEHDHRSIARSSAGHSPAGATGRD